MKKHVGTRVDDTVYDRLERIALKDRRSLGSAIELCIEAHLPVLERKILGEEFAGPVELVNRQPVKEASAA